MYIYKYIYIYIFPKLASANGVLADCLLDGWMGFRKISASAPAHFSAQALQTVRVGSLPFYAKWSLVPLSTIKHEGLDKSPLQATPGLPGCPWVPPRAPPINDSSSMIPLP